MDKIESKKIVVAGGSSGIGLAVVELLSGLHAKVAVISRSGPKPVDATDRSQLDSFFYENGHFDDLVVTLSGGKGAGLFRDLDLNHLRSGFEAKFFPQLQTVQAALPYLSPRGSITLVSAISSRSRLAGTSGLAAINAAIEAMVPTLAKELQPIRVNAISPGVIDTPWWNFLDADSKEKAFKGYSAQIPLGRVGKASDVAESIAFLVTNEYVTGVVLDVDGGIKL